MRFSPRTWALLSLMLFISAIFFWLKGDEYEARKRSLKPVPATNALRSFDLLSSNGSSLAQLNQSEPATPVPSQTKIVDSHFPFRLRNTAKRMGELGRDDKAILLANALIDTSSGQPLDIPESLKAKDDPGSYIVQWHGPADSSFRERLAAAKAEIVSYVPNNAYLVKATATQAAALKETEGVQAVLPFEPYYKLQASLLPSAVAGDDLPPETLLRLTLFPGQRDQAFERLQEANAQILVEERSPFGPQMVIRSSEYSLADLAQMPEVQGIEVDHVRVLSSDLSRIVMGVATNINAGNYLGVNQDLGLDGTNITVIFNDISVDEKYPGLTNHGRLVLFDGMGGTDVDGHGTFVANLIAGNGINSDSVTNATDENGVYTVGDRSFRGMAPEATLVGIPLDNGVDVYPHATDTYLTETAGFIGSGETLISNNSWNYPTAEYDSSAARFDAAVRDASPDDSGSQPILFVFSAGNLGRGNDDGFGGEADTIQSPATAKNVITVSALENARFITNFYVITNITTNSDGLTTVTNVDTNYPFLSITDSGDQVASFSARGNVGVGTEGDAGRFKPDVVAPGAFLISARSRGWNITNVVDTNSVPVETVGSVYGELQGNLGGDQYRYDQGTTFAAANVSGMLALMQQYYEQTNSPLAPKTLRGPLSPALMKALLINGSRSLLELYDLSPNKTINFQGWGLPNLPASLPSFSTNKHSDLPDEKLRLRFIEQSPTNALATGQSKTWNVSLGEIASVFPLRVTLVWTDPPGNPAVAVKLVNDLDLIVTNLESGVVFYGNDIVNGESFTTPSASNAPPIFDFVNNVENIFIQEPDQFGTNYSITVRAKRVNVNSVNSFFSTVSTNNFRTNDVVQDFALVLSSDMGTDLSLNGDDLDLREEDSFVTFDPPTEVDQSEVKPITTITNGLPLLNERLGANASLGATNEFTNQWRFYVFTNVYIPNDQVAITNGPNVAFITFDPPNLAVPRSVEADLDLYVSTDIRLLDLDTNALAASLKSVDRGGTEMVVLTNAEVGADKIFYIAVKSEDQQAAEFSLIGVSSQEPFEQQQGGRTILTAVPFSSFVPDGAPNKPGSSTMIGIGLNTRRVLRAVVNDRISHEDIGDLEGILSHKGQQAVLNNHTLNNGKFSGTNSFIYDDNRAISPSPGSQPTDGPGSLNNFIGSKIVGPWFLTMIDNAPTHTGRVEFLSVTIDPLQKELNAGTLTHVTVNAGVDLFYPIDVPAGVTNMIFQISNLTAPVQFTLRKGDLPETNIFDFQTNAVPPGLNFAYGQDKTPPAGAGTWYLRVHTDAATADFDMLLLYEFDINADNLQSWEELDPALKDDARNNFTAERFDSYSSTNDATIFLSADKVVTGVNVSVRMEHPRVADTVLRLVGPQGTNVVLFENRGRTDTNGLGTIYFTQQTITNGDGSVSTNQVSNYAPVEFTENTNLAQAPVKFLPLPLADLSTNVGTRETYNFETAVEGNYVLNSSVDGWTVTTNQISIVTDPTAAYEGTNYAMILNGAISRTIPTLKGRSYRLTFGYRAAANLGLFSTGIADDGKTLLKASDPHYQLLSSPQAASQFFTLLPRVVPAGSLPPGVAPNNGSSQWINFAELLLGGQAADDPAGIYIYRTHFAALGTDLNSIMITGQWWADDRGTDIVLNGKSLGLGNNGSAPAGAAPINISSQKGTFVKGINTLDFYVSNAAIGFEGLRTELKVTSTSDGTATNAYAIGHVVLGTSDPATTTTNTFVGSSDWKLGTIEFIAPEDNMTLALDAGIPGLLIDDVELLDTGIIYAQPEESLEVFNNQRSMGKWTLQLVDDRTGAVIPFPQTLYWKLDLSLADPDIRVEPLLPGVGTNSYPSVVHITQSTNFTPGIIYTNQVYYFAVQTCPATTSAKIILTGKTNIGGLELLMNRNGLPTGNPESDDYVVVSNSETNKFDQNGSVTNIITISSPAAAPLEPGYPLFLAVRNTSIDETNTIESLTVELDNDACLNQPAAQALSNHSQFSSGLNSSSSGLGVQSALYSYEVSQGGAALTFQSQANGPAEILVSPGVPPTLDSYAYRGVAGIPLTIDSLSPTPLSPGTWYVAVVNDATRTIRYSVGVDELGGVVLHISGGLIDGKLQLSFNTIPERHYRIETSVDLFAWTELEEITASGTSTTYDATVDDGTLQRFYRVVELPQ